MSLSKFLLITIILIFISACSNKSYPDFSHYNLNDYSSEIACDNSRQCKAIGYGVGSSCGPTYEGGVAGFLIYSTKMGPKNVRRLKKLAAESRKKTKPKKAIYSFGFQTVEYELEECLPAHYYKPNPICYENECRWR